MSDKESTRKLTRRDFIKSTGCVAVGMAMGAPVLAEDIMDPVQKSRVVLVRHPDAVAKDGTIDGKIVQQMLDDAVAALFGTGDAATGWRRVIRPEDIVGIKTNLWRNLPTTTQVETAIKTRVMDVGVAEKNISIDDHGILDNPVFKNATALINARPMRTHSWSGVGSLIKNYIMFSPSPDSYHDNACASLGAVWQLPMCRDKTRLNVLVMLTPLFYGVGPHHFDRTYVWGYHGLLVGTDPVAVDTVGVRIFQAKRNIYFGEDRPIKPTAHHIVFADKKYGLGTSDINKIEIVRLGWQEGILI